MSQLATWPPPPQVGKHIYGCSPPARMWPATQQNESMLHIFITQICNTIHRNALRLHYYIITLFIQLYNQTLASHNTILEHSFSDKGPMQTYQHSEIYLKIAFQNPPQTSIPKSTSKQHSKIHTQIAFQNLPQNRIPKSASKYNQTSPSK